MLPASPRIQALRRRVVVRGLQHQPGRATGSTVRRGGIIVQVGTLPAQGMPMLANLIMSRELDLRGSFRFGNVFEQAVAAIALRRVDVRPVLSGQHPLTQAAQAITLARDKTQSMKVQLIAG